MKSIRGDTMNQNKQMILLVVAITFFMGIMAVSAVFYSNAVVKNRFKTMTYHVDVEEEFYDDWGTKKITVKNQEKTNTPVALRVSFHESFTKDDFTLSNTINGEEVVDKEFTSEFVSHFRKASDGWYYYDQVLDPEESVQILNSIQLKEDLIQTSEDYELYKTYHYELGFQYEAIQATEGAIKEIWGKNASIVNHSIQYL